MCLELTLAIIYFLATFTINLFLYKLLQNYIKNISRLTKKKQLLL